VSQTDRADEKRRSRERQRQKEEGPINAVEVSSIEESEQILVRESLGRVEEEVEREAVAV
jgi:hypothetical protein